MYTRLWLREASAQSPIPGTAQILHEAPSFAEVIDRGSGPDQQREDVSREGAEFKREPQYASVMYELPHGDIPAIRRQVRLSLSVLVARFLPDALDRNGHAGVVRHSDSQI